MAGLKKITGIIKNAAKKVAKKAAPAVKKIIGINPEVKPSGTGCVECLSGDHPNGAWWLHLRRCALCGHVGCCDSSPNEHATKHFHKTSHPIIQSFEPGETWFYDYTKDNEIKPGIKLAAPTSHPKSQPVPFYLPDGVDPGNDEGDGEER